METCSLSEFMKAIDPWLTKDYIRKACLDDHGHFRLTFTDGVINTYDIDDCTKSQLKSVLIELKLKGVPIEE